MGMGMEMGISRASGPCRRRQVALLTRALPERSRAGPNEAERSRAGSALPGDSEELSLMPYLKTCGCVPRPCLGC